MAVSIKSILNTLNTHNYSDFSVFLQDTDWSGLTPATIVPKKEMRKFVKAIEDREVRLAVMKFLYDYTDAYFFEGAEAIDRDEYNGRGLGAAIYSNMDTYKTVSIGIPIETIISSNDREALLLSILEFFEGQEESPQLKH